MWSFKITQKRNSPPRQIFLLIDLTAVSLQENWDVLEFSQFIQVLKLFLLTYRKAAFRSKAYSPKETLERVISSDLFDLGKNSLPCG